MKNEKFQSFIDAISESLNVTCFVLNDSVSLYSKHDEPELRQKLCVLYRKNADANCNCIDVFSKFPALLKEQFQKFLQTANTFNVKISCHDITSFAATDSVIDSVIDIHECRGDFSDQIENLKAAVLYARYEKNGIVATRIVMDLLDSRFEDCDAIALSSFSERNIGKGIEEAIRTDTRCATIYCDAGDDTVYVAALDFSAYSFTVSIDVALDIAKYSIEWDVGGLATIWGRKPFWSDAQIDRNGNVYYNGAFIRCAEIKKFYETYKKQKENGGL